MLWLFRTSRLFHLSVLGDTLLLDTTVLHCSYRELASWQVCRRHLASLCGPLALSSLTWIVLAISPFLSLCLDCHCNAPLDPTPGQPGALRCWSSLPNTARTASCELWWFIFTAQLMRFRITMETHLWVCPWGHFQKCLAEQGKTHTGCGHHYHTDWSPNRTRVRHQHSPSSASACRCRVTPRSPPTMT